MRCIEPQESTAETKYWIGSLKACLYVSINVDLHIILFRLGSNNIFGLAQTAVDGANRYQRPFGVADETFQFQTRQFRNGGLFVEATTQGEGRDILTF